MVAFALLAPAGATAEAPASLAAPFSFDAAVPRHGPERIDDAVPPRALLGAPYSHQFGASGQTAPAFSANADDLPDGLGLDPDGLLSGVPTRSGRYFFVVFVAGTGSEGTEQQVNLDVVAPPKPVLHGARPFAATEAALSGSVDPGNLPVEAWFEYWSSETPLRRTPVEASGAGVKPFDIETNVKGLVPALEYSFRLAATSELSPDPVYSETGTLRIALPPPKAGQSFNVAPVGGSVSTKCSDDSAFSPLKRPKQVTLDCQIDSENGTVSVTASKGGGKTQTADFWGGMFDIDQEAGDNREAVVSLAGQRRCEKRSGKARRPLRSRKKGKGGRKLWGSGSGNYKTVGGHGAATVRGTTWLVADRCDGSTLFKVKKGTVVVRDFIEQATVVLEAGESYVARVDVGRLP